MKPTEILSNNKTGISRVTFLIAVIAVIIISVVLVPTFISQLVLAIRH